MQVLTDALSPKEIVPFSDETGQYINAYLFSTKPNAAQWRIKPRADYHKDKIQGFLEQDFAIIPHLIQKPPEEGGGGHYWGTPEQVKQAYADFSHGKIKKILGPYKYEDGTDDYYYRSIIKLRDTKAASILQREGSRTWVPFAVSPHISHLAGPDDDITDWEPLGLALVIKGAYGNESVITKWCDGTFETCERALTKAGSIIQRGYTSIPVTGNITFANTTGTGTSAYTVSGTTIDTNNRLNSIITDIAGSEKIVSEIISSLETKAASTSTSMENNNKDLPSAPTDTSNSKVSDKQPKNTTVNPQDALTNSALQTTTVISVPELEALKERAEAFTEMENERKSEILTSMFSVYQDEKEREAEIKDFGKHDMKSVKLLKSFHDKLVPKLKEQVKAELEAAAKEAAKANATEDKNKKPTKGASINSTLRPEPHVKDEPDTKAASIPGNEVAQLRSLLMKGRVR